ncbi:hypothetical protein KM031_21535 (plasmid) [Gemmobacter fulvus]|uniref:Uncharacterized protein n=1 Tax=Gemmobacter fulvus TaxID=2840474 RepID=A0A975PB01_9RHOB|nr:hypothetical protein [Gemmobacter fulvus]MBT9247952.1 hypothetical protein [Gemmobacter fulvus]QWK93010.1 hypothetical protein KM031_21535 [Gemmobacter fulvus]
MYSWEFSERYPVLTDKQADRIVVAHGFTPQAVKAELGAAYTKCETLLAWLGY